jgi:hypothetical protein
MTRAVRTLAVASLVVTWAVVSLGPPAVASSTAKRWKPPCSVVKNRDVGEVVGTTITRAKNSRGTVPSCQYFDASTDEAVVSIWFNSEPLGPAANTFAFDADQAKKNDINRNFETVAGVGRKAFFFESDELNRFEALVGKRLFFVQGSTLTLAQGKAIAERVIAKG